MGIRSSSSTATTVRCEDVYDYKPSRKPIHQRLLAWLACTSCTDGQPKKDHLELKQMHKSIKANRNDVQECMDDWELYRATWRRRSKAWAKGKDISAGECRAGRFNYDTAYRYEVTVECPISGTETRVIDFRTPEGRVEAVRWYEMRYKRCIKIGKNFLHYYDTWEDEYKEYTHLTAKRRDPADLAVLRRALLHGVPKVYWSTSTAKRLPN